MSLGESSGPPAVPPPEAGRKRRLFVVVVVAVLIAAAIGATAFVLLFGGQPVPPALSRVEVSATSDTIDQIGTVDFSAKAIDTSGIDQTANASFAWNVSPAGGVEFTTGTTQPIIRVQGILAGTATLTAAATWQDSSAQGSLDITIRAVHFEIQSNKLDPLVGEDTVTLFVRAARSDGTTATDYAGRVNFTVTDYRDARLPRNTTFFTADKGLKSFPVTVLRAGPVEITVRDTKAPITGAITLTGNRRPVPVFAIVGNATDPRKITVDGRTSFDPDGGDSVTSYAWDFGDGGTATTEVANHTYLAAGTYAVGLTVRDTHGAPNATTKAYRAKAPPTARFRISGLEELLGGDIVFRVDASQSSDSDGFISTYNWTWGDGNFTEVGIPQTNYTYNSSWVGRPVVIVLRVTDNESLTDTISRQVTVFVPVPPVVAFEVTSIDRFTRTVSVDARNTTDRNGDIAYYNWTWGDGKWTNTTVPVVNYRYASDGTYIINLTVVDSANLKNWTEQTVQVIHAPPQAAFTVSRAKLRVNVDAGVSTDLANDIVSYVWDWGDGKPPESVASPIASHDYVAPGLYTITLTVVDAISQQGNATKKVNVANSTLEVEIFDMFAVPYREWWDYRGIYGDFPLGADCFSFESIPGGASSPNPDGSGVCDTGPPGYTGETWATYPYMNPIAWVGDRRDIQVYAPYRMRMAGFNQPGSTLAQPVYLPVFNPAEPAGATLKIDWDMDYVTKNEALTIDALCGSNSAPADDGFILQSFVNVTMDLQESKRIFGVVATTPDEAATWWAANSDSDCAVKLGVESQWENFMVSQGGIGLVMGVYDLYSSFEWFYQPYMTNVFASKVDPATGETTVSIRHLAWGTEVLLARWFYWGPTLYLDPGADGKTGTIDDIVNAEIYPHNNAGWWPWELAWLEDLHLNTTIGTTSQSFTLETVMQYHFTAYANPGPDGVYNTTATPSADDIAEWLWMPVLTDYAYGGDISVKHTTSELDPYIGKTYYYGRPGMIYYGTQYKYDLVPKEWDLPTGSTVVFRLPTRPVKFVDPDSPRTSDSAGRNLIFFDAPIGFYRSTPALPAGSSATDSNGDGILETVTLMWPIDWGAPNQALWGAPALEFTPRGQALSAASAGAQLSVGSAGQPIVASEGTRPGLFDSSVHPQGQASPLSPSAAVAAFAALVAGLRVPRSVPGLPRGSAAWRIGVYRCRVHRSHPPTVGN